MREEYELEVLEKYDIEVKSTRRIRGAFFLYRQRAKVRARRRLWRLACNPVVFLLARRAITIRKKGRCCSKRQNCQSGAPFFYMTL